MDTFAQQTNSPKNSNLEDSTLYAVTDVLQILITSVDEVLRNTECIFCGNSGLPNKCAKELKSNNESKGKEDVNRTGYAVHNNEESNLTAQDLTNYQMNFLDSFQSSDCMSRSNSLPPVMCISEKQSSYSKKHEDRRSEFMSGSNYWQALLNVQEYQNSQKKQDLETLGKEGTDSLENDENTDDTRINPVRKLSLNNEWIANHRENSIDNHKEDRFEDIEMIIDCSDSDDDDNEEFIDDPTFEEMGDHEDVGDLDDDEFIERVVQYIRETDALIMANRGGGDCTLFDSDEDSD